MRCHRQMVISVYYMSLLILPESSTVGEDGIKNLVWERAEARPEGGKSRTRQVIQLLIARSTYMDEGLGRRKGNGIRLQSRSGDILPIELETA